VKEYQFRVWDRYLKCYHYGNQSPDVIQALIFYNSRYIIEQYIGIKDKNGKYIYEGDILASSNNNSEYDIWDEKCLGYTIVYYNEEDLCFVGSEWFIKNYSDEDDDSIYGKKFISVVGNIHENSNLLKE